MKKVADRCNLKDCFLCRLCVPEWIPAVAVGKENYLLKKGEQLFREGDRVEGIFFVYEGAMKVHKRWEDQKELILRFARKGDIVGHLGLGSKPVYPLSATALEPSVVCFLPMPFFESTLKVNTDLTYQLMRFFANELQDSQKRMGDLAHMPVRSRIAQSILSLRTQFGVNSSGFIDLEITRQDLASFAGTTYETFFKVSNELTREKMIVLSGKNVGILHEQALLQLIGDGPESTPPKSS
ncbi:MAG TPA: Crp/Fnr family transcriptional regulator [Sphingobacteriaceae bacterium]